MGNLMSASFAPECNEVKTKYDNCFNEWYSESKFPYYYLFLSLFSLSNLCLIEFLKGKGVSFIC